MSTYELSRRDFVIATGVVLGASTLLTRTGVAATVPVLPDVPRAARFGNEAPILVTYATAAGSTIGVAEAIAETLREAGMPVELHPMADVRDVTPYRAVVAGSPIQGQKWLPEAMAFVKTHQAALAQRPFAAFLLCMTLAMPNGEKYRPSVAEWLAPVRALVRPVSEGLFAGVLDLSKVPSFGYRLAFRIAVALGFWKEGDHRDWQAISAWAAELKPLLVGSHAG